MPRAPAAGYSASAAVADSMATVAVMPAASSTPGGTRSMWMRTGMRWASIVLRR
ncbi:hypothetical protein [Azospirillum sp.]|uniref:hypothetical protein n=1 Tax=Azospirillum sp. TaxID=34012 RepID=UPI0039C8642F